MGRALGSSHLRGSSEVSSGDQFCREMGSHLASLGLAACVRVHTCAVSRASAVFKLDSLVFPWLTFLGPHFPLRALPVTMHLLLKTVTST